MFGPGFEIRTDDDEYIFQFHNLTQFEYRGYEQYGQGTVNDSFLIPRQWFMFSGRITKPIGYFVSFANGFDTVTMLDVFLDFDFDPRFRIRAGRFKTPFTYEFLVEPIQGLILPERSLFFNNFGQNRDLGVMAFGRLFNNTFDYATGIFNGNRNGYVAVSRFEVHVVVHQLEAVHQRRRARSSRTSTSAARSSAAIDPVARPDGPADDRADRRQRGRRRAVPRLQQQRAAVGDAHASGTCTPPGSTGSSP